MPRWANRTSITPAPDLEAMRPEQIQEFLDSWPRGTPMTTWALTVFPDKPGGFRDTSKRLYWIANRIKRGVDFEELYEQLPKYAQWRRWLNPKGCVLPGKKFRKTTPKQDRNGHWH